MTLEDGFKFGTGLGLAYLAWTVGRYAGQLVVQAIF